MFDPIILAAIVEYWGSDLQSLDQTIKTRLPGWAWSVRSGPDVYFTARLSIGEQSFSLASGDPTEALAILADDIHRKTPGDTTPAALEIDPCSP